MQKRSFLISVILISLALLSIKFFKLTLTLPIIFIGIAILLIVKCLNNKLPKYVRLSFENLGILFLFIGSIFSFFNLSSIINKKSLVPQIYLSGSYQISGNFKKNKNVKLGYRYRDNIKKLTSKKIRQYSSKKEIIYDVVYSIDNNNNRYTPTTNKVNKGKTILFLGGSYTFGEGLNDNETLSFYMQNLTGLSSINAGLHGYGAHQALFILEDDKLFNKKTRSHSIKTIIYRAIPEHIGRTAGNSSWDIYGPCYQLNSDNQLLYKGSFIDCKIKKTNIFKKIIDKVSKSNEPFTSNIFSKINMSLMNPLTITNKEYQTFIEVIKKMHFIANKKDINFIVLFEDFDINNSICQPKEGISQKVIQDLQAYGIQTIPTSAIFKNNTCSKYNLSIEFDGHPTKYANMLIADYLAKIINNEN